jgi:multiple sugar transport system permease protein
MDGEKGILGLIRPLLRDSVLVVYALFALFPLIWMVILSFKPDDQMVTSVFVFTPTLENFRAVLGSLALE